MTFRPKDKNPDFSRLKGTLAQMKKGDNALYDTVATMIDWLTQFKLKTEADILDLNNSINDIETDVTIVAEAEGGYPPQLGHSSL